MKEEHSVAALCAALGVSRPGYYRWKGAEPGARAREDAELRAAICEVHGEHRGVYGSPRVLRVLRARGRCHSRKRIARLMRAEGLCGKSPRRFVPRTTEEEEGNREAGGWASRKAGTINPSPRTGWPKRPNPRLPTRCG